MLHTLQVTFAHNECDYQDVGETIETIRSEVAEVISNYSSTEHPTIKIWEGSTKQNAGNPGNLCIEAVRIWEETLDMPDVRLFGASVKIRVGSIPTIFKYPTHGLLPYQKLRELVENETGFVLPDRSTLDWTDLGSKRCADIEVARS